MPAMNAHILIVDDEVTLSLFLQRYLSAMRPGDLIETVTTAASAFARLERGGYDLVIVDHILPDASGFSVINYARSLKPTAEGILMTGYSSLALRHAARDAGVAWLTKPFDLRAMLNLVAACLGEASAPRPVELPVAPAAAD